MIRAALFLVIVLSCAPLGAHDFWLEPSTFRPAPGAVVTMSLRVGENFEGERVARRSARLETFVVRDAAGERAVEGREGRDPAGFVRVDDAAVIGYHGKPHTHELSRAKFEQFLREEGLDHVRVRGDRQRERFHRFAKTQLGNATTTIGFRYELVPVRDDVFRVLYDQQPLPNAHVAALSRDGRRLTARTDRNGEVTLHLGRGVWLLKSVHLLPAPQGADYDWDSLWASLTLER